VQDFGGTLANRAAPPGQVLGQQIGDSVVWPA
jgi:hypothetical protein